MKDPKWRRLQVILSVLVIFACLAWLVLDFSEEQGSVKKSELSECHFLLKHSYHRAVDALELIRASAEVLNQKRLEVGLGPKDLELQLGELTEEEALARLEALAVHLAEDSGGVISRQDAVYLGIEGMLEVLDDPWTVAMDPETYLSFKLNLHSHPFGGVGLELGQGETGLVVFSVLPESPADVAGILAGDSLLEIDGKSTVNLNAEEAESLLRGNLETSVQLVFKRDGETFTRTLTRVVLKSRSVESHFAKLPAGGKAFWVNVKSMTKSTPQELVSELKRLEAENANGLILDLRNNMGGYVKATVETASLFLEPGNPVLSMEMRDGTEDFKTTGKPSVNLPVVVFVNKNTASAAEILAACLQDYKRAIVVGHQSFGKGSVQNLHEFESGGALKFTTARYLTPKKQVLDGHGLTPDEWLEEKDILSFCEKQWKN